MGRSLSEILFTLFYLSLTLGHIKTRSQLLIKLLQMPTVYTFSRSDAEIQQELLKVFSTGRGTAREQWSSQAEFLVEPVGWDALWKLSKEFCKKFGKFSVLCYLKTHFSNVTSRCTLQ